ncbi:MAG TPA: ComEC/Rec2 family competence protein, partial [Solirubrobacterales bacterium]|nr:ComEC/Rec2 family competence protein [Solirubrobacterales bacterium]
MKHLGEREWAREWRSATLVGTAIGLGAAQLAPPDPSLAAAGALPIAGIALAAVRPDPSSRPWIAGTWLALLGLVAALAGFLVGGARVHAIDAGALQAGPRSRVSLSGFVAGVPRRARGEVSVPVSSSGGRVLVIAPEPVADLPVGSELRVDGVLQPPEPWRAAHLRRQGIAMTLRTQRIDRAPGTRTGLTRWTDAVRLRAERALGRGMPQDESALARGFVLGEDDRIDPRTRDDFQRSNLAHLLAVSGENVILLGVLAWPLLALLGLRLRARLIATLCLIAIYVPVTGAGPSIQRAGVMGAAGLIAALADRPRSRWYAVLLAATVTLAVNPRADGDVGWQLSFAAVIGIMLWSRRLSGLIAGGTDRRSARRALAEAIAVTAAATVATAPLMAAAFDQFSPAALPANVLAAPAVAPAMWLGMLTGIVGQAPFLPVEPINWVDSLCLAYIAQVAHWLAAPRWASLTVHLGSIWSVAAAYAVLILGMELVLRGLRRISSNRLGPSSPKTAGLVAVALVATGAAALWPFDSRATSEPASRLTVRVLDVGQGDSILLQPAGAEPVLVDTGPPDDGVEHRLRELGIDRLAAIVITHDQSDHAGDLGALLASVRAERLVYGRDDARLRGVALAAGTQPYRLAEGGMLEVGGLRLTALWPPRELLHDTDQDP